MSKLRGMLHSPGGPHDPEHFDWRDCPNVVRPCRAWRHDFNTLNKLERGELPEVTACPECLPRPDLIAHDVILVTPR